MNDQSTQTPVADGCPAWAAEIIGKIRLMEIELGNIIPAGDKYATRDLDELAARLSNDEDLTRTNLTATGVDALFAKLAKDLTQAGHAPDVIAKFVNARVAPESRLPYCSADEVREALKPH